MRFLGTAVKICTDLATSDKLQQPICDGKFCEMFLPIVEGLLINARNFDADPALIHAIEELYTDAKNSPSTAGKLFCMLD